MTPTPPRATSATPNLSAETGIIDTIQSLIVAFVLAMAFRGFVAEGFVIPTGSMAPTLMGQHVLLHSELTGYTFPIGMDRLPGSNNQAQREMRLVDPMLGPAYPAHAGLRPSQERPRMGDRILVLKTIYPFFQPERFDVVVFKNPTDPKGESANYIKRLIGLPGEEILLVDGDVFVREDSDMPFTIRRKPEHVQRALWQPVYHSEYALVNEARLDAPYPGPPWVGEHWVADERRLRSDRAEPTMLEWDYAQRPLDDWTAYNMLTTRTPPLPVSDLRIAAGIVPDEAGLETTLELEARDHVFSFTLTESEAVVRFRHKDEPNGWIAEERTEVQRLQADRVTNVEFWHVDQALTMFVDGRQVVSLEYEWDAPQRNAFASVSFRDQLRPRNASADAHTRLRWHFSGSPVTLHRVRTDRDLFYRAAMLDSSQQRNDPEISGPAFGTHPSRPARLGENHFFMLGDNSQASLDSRLWGSPHPLIAEQIDDAPFVVHRDLLIGKAWVVYFPAPHPITDGGVNIIPDFGRLRYIR